MRKAFAVVVLVIGLGFFALGGHVALEGAEPRIPSGEGAIEGRVLGGETMPSPAGEPFLYGMVELTEAPRNDGRPSSTRIDRSFGDPALTIRSDGEDITLVFPEADRWTFLDDHPDRKTTDSLASLPLVGEVDTGGLLSPPYRISVVAIREGDHVIAERSGDRATQVHVGDREILREHHDAREAMRWPVVALLFVMGAVSVMGTGMLIREPKPS